MGFLELTTGLIMFLIFTSMLSYDVNHYVFLLAINYYRIKKCLLLKQQNKYHLRI